MPAIYCNVDSYTRREQDLSLGHHVATRRVLCSQTLYEIPVWCLPHFRIDVRRWKGVQTLRHVVPSVDLLVIFSHLIMCFRVCLVAEYDVSPHPGTFPGEHSGCWMYQVYDATPPPRKIGVAKLPPLTSSGDTLWHGAKHYKVLRVRSHYK